MCVIDICDKCEREPVPLKSSNPNKKKHRQSPTTKRKPTSKIFFSPTKILQTKNCVFPRFGALVDETGRFVWCCMDTYGGRDHPVNLLHVGGVGDVMDVG